MWWIAFTSSNSEARSLAWLCSLVTVSQCLGFSHCSCELDSSPLCLIPSCFVTAVIPCHCTPLPSLSQVQSSRDIAAPDSSTVDTLEDPSSPTGPHRRRMLRLELTDGRQRLVAVEHHPCPHIPTNLAPGTKVHSALQCCRDVMSL